MNRGGVGRRGEEEEGQRKGRERDGRERSALGTVGVVCGLTIRDIVTIPGPRLVVDFWKWICCGFVGECQCGGRCFLQCFCGGPAIPFLPSPTIMYCPHGSNRHTCDSQPDPTRDTFSPVLEINLNYIKVSPLGTGLTITS